MENASKALIIAGSVLLSLLVIAALVFIFNGIGDITNAKDEAKQIEQITAFNKQFESYNKGLLRGAEVYSVINKIRDNNKMYAEKDSSMYIAWKLTMKDKFTVTYTYKVGDSYVEHTYLNAGEVCQETDINQCTRLNDVIEDKYMPSGAKEPQSFKEFKRLYFKCTNVEYSDTGRIKYMEFKQYSTADVESFYT